MIRLIVAIDRKRGIAKQGFQPWYIPEDEQYFSEQTKSLGAEILVGSTTYKTFGGPLPERQNHVLTSNRTPLDGAHLVHDLGAFLKEYNDGGRDLWVIGGANLYAQVMEAGKADELYITHIEADFGCNQFFPEHEKNFSLAEQTELHEQNGFIFTYARYTKQ
ncbi:MAG: dihydrofolate reductase [Candidatus Saccharibacteria bacterium]|jgi:dihydrofolate reductase|nr:dihydrofolate reductase [Candidatus Saccharibacteria bacterium]